MVYKRPIAKLYSEGSDSFPPGLVADILAHATEVNESEGWYTLTDEAFTELRGKWLAEVRRVVPRAPRPPSPPPIPLTPEQARARQEAKAEQERIALPGAWERLTKGAWGLTRVALHIDRSPDALIAERKAICEACPHLKGGRCDLCGCSYKAKVRLASEACPDKPPRW